MSNMTDAELEKMTGYAVCEFPPDADPCESCGAGNVQLYYHGPADSASYLCHGCVVKLYNINLEWGKKLIGVADGD